MSKHTPYESAEYLEKVQWRQRVQQKKLAIVPCLSAWFDICGYGKVLENVQWKLESLRDSGLFDALANAYALLGSPMVVGMPPMPSERILIINDGIARTVDMIGQDYASQASVLMYLRELLIRHFQLQSILIEKSLGLRTVLAGGERCQYTPSRVTGQSILHQSSNPSEFGKSLLAQQFVYHPAEFQMNTAFAMAYTIEGLGSKSGIKPNRIYIARTWLDTVSNVIPELVVISDRKIHFMLQGQKAISVAFDDCFPIKAKGFSTEIFNVSEFTVHKWFEGEETIFPMARHDVTRPQ